MTDEEIVSLIRNWTVGELSTVSATVVYSSTSWHATAPSRTACAHPSPTATHSMTAAKSPRRRRNHATRRHPRHQPPHHHSGYRTRRPHQLRWLPRDHPLGKRQPRRDAFEDALTTTAPRPVPQPHMATASTSAPSAPGTPGTAHPARGVLRGTESIEIADERKPATVNAVYPVSGYSVVRAIFN